MTAELAIKTEGLFRRRGERQVLRNLDLELPAGATLALLGPNGAGKSTLLQILAGLLRPTGGKCEVLGHSLPSARDELRGKVAYLPHRPALYRELTVRENLVHRARLLRVQVSRVDEMLEAVSLRPQADFSVGVLSRGQTQRASLAVSLLGDPQLLLLDEPLANLDPAASEQVAPLLSARTAEAEGGPRTVIVASHDPEAALQSSDVALGLRLGEPVLVGNSSVVSSAQVEELYR